MNVSGARILITGGASGIGRECVRLFHSLGAQVFVLDKDEEALGVLSSSFEGLRAGHLLVCDVGDAEQVASSVGRMFSVHGGIDAVVNNAAVLRDQMLVSRLGKRVKLHSLDDWHETLSANLTGTFLVSREVAGRWLDLRQPGVIVNTSSVVRTGNPGQTAYAATKAAIEALTVTWSQELSPYRIRVAGIAYGFAMTPMTRAIHPLFLERIRERTPVGRFAELDELASGVRFILENDYIAGRVLDLDGGLRF